MTFILEILVACLAMVFLHHSSLSSHARIIYVTAWFEQLLRDTRCYSSSTYLIVNDTTSAGGIR